MRWPLILALAIAVPGCGESPSAPTAAVTTTTTTTTTLPPLWSTSGSGNTVFDMPARVARVRIQGTWNNRGASNFGVFIASRLIVNAILRDSGGVYDGTHLTNGGGVTEIRLSDNIAWTFTEVR